MREPAPLIVFSDDWGRHPSSCQHLVQQLSTRRQVTWINTIGLRPPRFDRATVTARVRESEFGGSPGRLRAATVRRFRS